MRLAATLLAAGVIAMLTAAAAAAPLCLLVEGLPDSCIYVDPQSCQLRALQLDGLCVANPAELRVTGAGAFCTVDSSMAPQCLYADRQSCFAAAARVAGACIAAHQQPLDPFKTRRPY